MVGYYQFKSTFTSKEVLTVERYEMRVGLSSSDMERFNQVSDSLIEGSAPTFSILQAMSACATLLELSGLNCPDRMVVIEMSDQSELTEDEFVAINSAFDAVYFHTNYEVSVVLRRYGSWKPLPESRIKPEQPPMIHVEISDMATCIKLMDVIVDTSDPVMTAIITLLRSCIEMLRSSYALPNDAYLLISDTSNLVGRQSELLSYETQALTDKVLDQVSNTCGKRFQFHRQ